MSEDILKKYSLRALSACSLTKENFFFKKREGFWLNYYQPNGIPIFIQDENFCREWATRTYHFLTNQEYRNEVLYEHTVILKPDHNLAIVQTSAKAHAIVDQYLVPKKTILEHENDPVFMSKIPSLSLEWKYPSWEQMSNDYSGIFVYDPRNDWPWQREGGCPALDWGNRGYIWDPSCIEELVPVK